ncbi:MAG: hypothetical protein CVV03_00595 [Firmicutes bacterium HGW-Firmicutes-8]|nr:MAG: hypothetical protein CVV03_00595 [Firmicutes bacterium HGW-Firmicutes-8]
MIENKEKLLNPVFLLVSVMIGFLIAIFNHKYMLDDAYILLKYADNLVKLGEWTFNGLEKSNGSTSALYVLLLSLGGVFGQNIEKFSVILNAGIWAIWGGLTYIFLYILIEKRWLAFFGALSIITLPFFTSVYRMESHLVLVLQMAGLLFFIQKRYKLMSFFIGLAFLARPDTLALVAIIGIYFVIYKNKEIPWTSILIFGLVILPWLVYSWIKFGSVFPDTLSVKIGQSQSGFWPISFSQGLIEQVKVIYQQEPITLFLLIFILLLGIYAITHKIMLGNIKIKAIQGIMLAYVLTYFVAYAFILRVPNYHWYYTPIVYYSLIIILSLVPYFNIFGKATFSVILFSLVIIFSQNYFFNLPLQLKSNSSGHVEDYKVIGQYLKDNTPKEATVGATEVGVLAWVSERPIIDCLGLNNKMLADKVRTRDVGFWVVETEPDYLLFNKPSWVWQKATPHQEWEAVPWFREAYLQVKTFNLFRGEYILYKKQKSPKLAREHQSDMPTVAFPLDYEKDQYILGIAQSWKQKILDSKVLEKLGIKETYNIIKEKTENNKYKNLNGDPILELSLPQAKNVLKKQFFLKVAIKADIQAKPQIGETTGQLFIATKRFPSYLNSLPLSFRVILDNNVHQYYIPLYLNKTWLNLEEIISLRLDPMSDLGQFEIKSIELAAIN